MQPGRDVEAVVEPGVYHPKGGGVGGGRGERDVAPNGRCRGFQDLRKDLWLLGRFRRLRLLCRGVYRDNLRRIDGHCCERWHWAAPFSVGRGRVASRQAGLHTSRHEQLESAGLKATILPGSTIPTLDAGLDARGQGLVPT